MSEGNFRSSVPVERIDADAVCEQCGAVNPEETLICKTCGNNLRDQRARRLNSEQDLDIGDMNPARGTWVRGLLVIFGLLILVFFAKNASRIEDMMVDIQAAKLSDATAYWKGVEGQKYDELAKELADNAITQDEQDQAIKRTTPPESFEGRYVLVNHTAVRDVPVGQALVKKDGEVYRFVATFDNPGVEVRGEARLEGQSRLASRDSGGLKLYGKYYGVSGFAQPIDTGALECLGLSDQSEDAFNALAFLVP
jgi:ribosomal protein L40E